MAAEAGLAAEQQQQTQQQTQQREPKRTANFQVELQAIEDYRRFAALTIQRYVRGWLVRLRRTRREAAQRQQQQSAAAQHAEAARLCKSARTIQDAWRGYKNKRVYRFYRDLIRFREAADPRQLLRHINAAEAALVDPAAGLHVRLRLGGSSFPPILLYKVFTHRPVTDICAFGPRNYAAESANPSKAPTTAAKAADSRQQASARPKALQDSSNANSSSSSTYASRTGWYCRDDRNGWRPVIELQQQRLDHGQAASGCAGSSGCSTSRHRALPLRQRRSRLQLAAHSKASSSGKGRVTAGCAGLKDVLGSIEEAGKGSGCRSEPEAQPGRAAFLQRRQQQHFHHSPLVRRAERAQRLKQRRRQWLLKMYKAGMQAGACSPGGSLTTCTPSTAAAAAAAASFGKTSSSQLPQQQAAGATQQCAPCHTCSSEQALLQQLEQQLLCRQTDTNSSSSSSTARQADSMQCVGQGSWSARGSSDGGWGPDELLLLGLDAGILAWAQQLDFNSYQQQWSSMAVTLGSEAAVPQSERALLQQLG